MSTVPAGISRMTGGAPAVDRGETAALRADRAAVASSTPLAMPQSLLRPLVEPSRYHCMVIANESLPIRQAVPATVLSRQEGRSQATALHPRAGAGLLPWARAMNMRANPAEEVSVP